MDQNWYSLDTPNGFCGEIICWYTGRRHPRGSTCLSADSQLVNRIRIVGNGRAHHQSETCELYLWDITSEILPEVWISATKTNCNELMLDAPL